MSSDGPEKDLNERKLDLIELMGGDWQVESGGRVVSVLANTANNKPSNATNGRIKSLNPLAHLVDKRLQQNGQRDGPAVAQLVDAPPVVEAAPPPRQPPAQRPRPAAATTTTTPLQSQFRALSEQQRNRPSKGGEEGEIGVGSMVEVAAEEDIYCGVVRWTGAIRDVAYAGVELEEEHRNFTDGTHEGRRYFSCPPGRALFAPVALCKKDGRFQDAPPAASRPESIVAGDFGQVECPVVPGCVPPLNHATDLEGLCGKYRGIQGHHNSCYLDATLFSMFTFTSVFDSLLFRPPEPQDSVHYEEVQRVLREEIVNPLRQNLYVRADRVMKLRKLLEKLSSITGLTSEEKDPEEFLNSLVAQILRAEPFLKLNSGQEAFHYQLFVEKDENLTFPSVQQLFEQSFLTSNIKLKEVPSCLIIQMPRFGKTYKMYPRILPSQLLDVTDAIEDVPRQCTVCGKLASFECRECFGQCGVGLESTAFCQPCLDTAHSHEKRKSHKPNVLSVPSDFKIMAEHCPVPRLYMELFAVVCIETSHYVAFVKAGSGHEAPWCFFDSMADRKGEQNGYNIPEIVLVDDISVWLNDDSVRSLHEAAPSDKMLPEHAKRLLCDAYMCMYQSPDVSMYR